MKIDSKGRLIVPFHIRNYLGLKEGTELIVANNGKKELKIFPLLNGSTARITVTAAEDPLTLHRILDVMLKNNIDILMSTSRTMDGGRTIEWSAIVDTSNCPNAENVEDALKKTKMIKKVEMEFK